MAIELFGYSSNPSDNGTNTTTPTVITPPASMQAGDLVIITACMAVTSGTVSISQAGGQSWTNLTQRNATRNRARSFWCVFNGTWDANPSVTLNSGGNDLALMLVFRPTGGTLSTWVVDGAEASNTYSAPTDPYTVTIPSLTTSYNGTLVVAVWTSADDNTWGSLTGSTHTWTAALSEGQIRNTSGSYDQSISAAYMIDAAAGATGTAVQNQATLGGDAGTYLIIGFREIERHSGSTTATGAGTVAVSGKKTASQASTSTLAGSLVALGIAAKIGLAAISGAGLVTTTGTAAQANPIVKVINETVESRNTTKFGVATSSGAGSVAATGSKGGAQAGTSTGAGSVASAGVKSTSEASSVTGGGAVNTTYSVSQLSSGAASVAGGGAVSGTGNKSSGSASTSSGAGAVTASGAKSASGSAAVTGAGSVATSGFSVSNNAIVKVINEVIQRRITGTSAVTGAGSVEVTGQKRPAEASTVSGGGSVNANGGVIRGECAVVTGGGSVAATGSASWSNAIVKVINEEISRFPAHVGVATVSGGGSVAATGAGGARSIVQVINESVNEVEGQFLTAQDIVQVVNEAASVVETKIRRTSQGFTEDVSVAGNGTVATQGRKAGSGATQVTGAGSVETTALTHARGASVSGGGSIAVEFTGAHNVRVSVSGGGTTDATASAPARRRYKRSFTHARTGNPQMDRQLQLIEEEFSRMLDYINRTTG